MKRKWFTLITLISVTVSSFLIVSLISSPQTVQISTVKREMDTELVEKVHKLNGTSYQKEGKTNKDRCRIFCTWDVNPESVGCGSGPGFSVHGMLIQNQYMYGSRPGLSVHGMIIQNQYMYGSGSGFSVHGMLIQNQYIYVLGPGFSVHGMLIQNQ